jgi:four helix bundle protein
MATIERFEDIEAWKRARTLCNLIFQLTALPTFSRDFDFRRQMRDAASSVMSNIAEGYERDSGDKDFRHFLSIAKGSAGEVRSQLYTALDNNFITQEQFNEATALAFEVCKMLQRFMAYLSGR